MPNGHGQQNPSKVRDCLCKYLETKHAELIGSRRRLCYTNFDSISMVTVLSLLEYAQHSLFSIESKNYYCILLIKRYYFVCKSKKWY